MKGRMCLALPIIGLIGANAAQASLADFTVTVEAPKVTNTTATFDYYGVETFDSRPDGVNNFTTNYGGSPITATYNGVNVVPVDAYGGAGGVGKYAIAGRYMDSTYSVSFTQTGAKGINYFGYWLSALDAGNSVEFFNGGTSLGTFDPSDVLSFVSGNNGYYGNPSTGYIPSEAYVFVNFFLKSGTFDKIVFNETANRLGQISGYESDNQTVGWFKTTGGGTPIGGVPEPSTWAMMIIGFGSIGGVLRNRRRKDGSVVSRA